MASPPGSAQARAWPSSHPHPDPPRGDHAHRLSRMLPLAGSLQVTTGSTAPPVPPRRLCTRWSSITWRPSSPRRRRPTPWAGASRRPTAHPNITRAPIPIELRPPPVWLLTGAHPAPHDQPTLPTLRSLAGPQAPAVSWIHDREGLWSSFYGASCQDTPPLHAVRPRFDGQRAFSPSPGMVACGVRWMA
jgi:hypothetical protein